MGYIIYMTLKNKETKITAKTIKSVFDEDIKSLRWYTFIWYWINHNIWERITDLKWQVPNLIGRMRRGWGNADTWEFCNYLGDVISGGLKHLKKIKHGYPATLDPLTGNYKYDEKRWERILDTMIWTFEIVSKINDTVYYIPTKDWTDKKYKEHITFVKKLNKQFPDIEQSIVLTKEESKRYEKGFSLFAKYFHSLWD